MISTRKVAATVMEGLSVRRGSRETPLRQGEVVREPANVACTRLTLWNIDGYFCALFLLGSTCQHVARFVMLRLGRNVNGTFFLV